MFLGEFIHSDEFMLLGEFMCSAEFMSLGEFIYSDEFMLLGEFIYSDEFTSSYSARPIPYFWVQLPLFVFGAEKVAKTLSLLSGQW
jgi:hypothetical protein